MYRITDSRFTDEMIAAERRGVQVRLMTEPQQYRDIRRIFHSYNIDLLYMNGVEIRHRVHAGLNHQKSVLLRGLTTAILGSSNWSSASAEYQEEHNLFTQDPVIYQWLSDQFQRKWNNEGGVQDTGRSLRCPLTRQSRRRRRPAHPASRPATRSCRGTVAPGRTATTFTSAPTAARCSWWAPICISGPASGRGTSRASSCRAHSSPGRPTTGASSRAPWRT